MDEDVSGKDPPNTQTQNQKTVQQTPHAAGFTTKIYQTSGDDVPLGAEVHPKSCDALFLDIGLQAKQDLSKGV